MRFPTRLELLLATLIGGIVNAPLALAHPRSWNASALAFCIGSTLGQIGLWIYAHRNRKEEPPSSPSQQPTSGTSQNPSRSSFLTGAIIPSPSPSLSEKSSESQFQPRPRAVPVVGFRSWHIDAHHRIGIGPGWRLASFNRSYGNWEPGKNNAICQHGLKYYGQLVPVSRPDFHAAPNAECSCGFYVLTDFDKVPFSTESVSVAQSGQIVKREPLTMMVGAVVGWGRVIQHADEGWRAEKVQLIALLDCKVSPEHLRITNEVAESYGVPVLGRRALELLAKEYGDRLTELEQAPNVPALIAEDSRK